LHFKGHLLANNARLLVSGDTIRHRRRMFAGICTSFYTAFHFWHLKIHTLIPKLLAVTTNSISGRKLERHANLQACPRNGKWQNATQSKILLVSLKFLLTWLSDVYVCITVTNDLQTSGLEGGRTLVGQPKHHPRQAHLHI